MGTFFISVVFFCTEALISATGNEDAAFRVYWLLNAYWEFIYFAIIAYISVKYLPGDDVSKYSLDAQIIEQKLKKVKKGPKKETVMIPDDEDDDLYKFRPDRSESDSSDSGKPIIKEVPQTTVQPEKKR